VLNELRDLDGEVVARARVIESDEECSLCLCNTQTGERVRVEGLDSIVSLRDLCDEMLREGAEE
jgi:hypothetical protein